MSLRSLCAWSCLGLVTPCPAHAVPYEVFIDIENENDLYDLLLTRQISERSFDALLLLLQTKVDLNTATRDALYALPNLDYAHVDAILGHRERQGAIRDPTELVESGVLPRRLLDAMVTFVRVQVRELDRADGFVRLSSRWSGRYDRLPPASAVQARVSAFGRLDAGLVGLVTRNGFRRLRWDPTRAGLSVVPPRVRFEVPKAYVQWEDERRHVAVGTYRIGFAERLTFDVTGQGTPDRALGDLELRRPADLVLRCHRGAGELAESPCSGVSGVRVTPDFAWTDRLTGLSVGVKRLPTHRGWLRAYVWASYQVHRLLESELVLSSRCRDARRDDDPSCRPPEVYVRDGRPTAPQSTTTRATLPGVFAEWLGGLHVAHYWSRRTRLGVTGYGAVPRGLVRGVELDFQESARRPSGGWFGAIGLSAAHGFRRQGFFVEATRSFDRQPDGGGDFGAIARSVTTWASGEVDVSARYYGTRFSNPYARPPSAPDELDGLRARDEAGIRLRATLGLAERLNLRIVADGWRRLSRVGVRATIYARLDVELTPALTWSVWGQHRSASRLASLAARLSYGATRALSVIAQIVHSRRPRASSAGGRQHDIDAAFTLRGSLGDRWRFRLRTRYDFQDVATIERLPHTVRIEVETSWRLRVRDTLELRYDVLTFLDQRPSTLERLPNPQHQLWFEYVFRY